MKNCSVVTFEGACGREGIYTIGNGTFCRDCALVQAEGTLDYINQYLNTILNKLDGLDPSLMSRFSTEMVNLTTHLLNARDLVLKMKM